ncbi:hypothetical protein WA026_023339 [Henosepilachna vigintioctopunctata]|uniref:Uncharacterized protein n=1 Tax=Henosepilachna vigintioctopunctata TaxID=420089 RepID=A0AAW1VJQ3_9CUCU
MKFTGKLGKDNAMLIHRDIGFKSIDLILKYRELAGVNKFNKYVLGIPSDCHSQPTLKACALIRRIAEESGIKDSQLIRTRVLRPHLATETAHENVDPRLESRVSDFMSHHRKIHEDYYVMSKKTDDITKVSTLLENFSSAPKTKQIVPHSSIELKRRDSASSTSDEESISDIDD